jgi:hypothetical protein
MFNPYHHTVPLFRFDAPVPWLDGTGVFLAVDEHRFIVTAAHVVEISAEKIAFGYQVPNEKIVQMFGHEKLPIITAKALEHAGTNKATYKDGVDLAVIVLPKEFAEWLEERYIPFDLRTNKPRDGVGVVIICGWPESKNRFNRRLKRFDDDFGCRHIQSQAALKEEVASIDGNPAIHFAVRMDKRRDFIDANTRKAVPQLFNLTGISGSGVWDMDIEDNEKFPECAKALAGIIVEDHPDKKLAKVIRVEHIWSPIVQMLGVHP